MKYTEYTKKTEEQLLEENSSLIPFTIKKFFKMESLDKVSFISYEDLYQNGLIGLMLAIRNFDPLKKYKFSSYAVTVIRNEINKLFCSHYTADIFYNGKIPVYLDAVCEDSSTNGTISCTYDMLMQVSSVTAQEIFGPLEENIMLEETITQIIKEQKNEKSKIAVNTVFYKHLTACTETELAIKMNISKKEVRSYLARGSYLLKKYKKYFSTELI